MHIILYPYNSNNKKKSYIHELSQESCLDAIGNICFNYTCHFKYIFWNITAVETLLEFTKLSDEKETSGSISVIQDSCKSEEVPRLSPSIEYTSKEGQ